MTTTALPHIYSSAIEAVLADAPDTGSPCFSSELHLGRPFVLTSTAYSWGHYAVNATRGPSPHAYRTAKANELAALFCDFLFEQQPELMLSFKYESAVLHAYYHRTAPVSAALSAVFDGAYRLHQVQREKFEYIGYDRGVQIASVWDKDGNEYCAFFDEQLMLTQVSKLRSGLGLTPRVRPTGCD